MSQPGDSVLSEVNKGSSSFGVCVCARSRARVHVSLCVRERRLIGWGGGGGGGGGGERGNPTLLQRWRRGYSKQKAVDEVETVWFLTVQG